MKNMDLLVVLQFEYVLRLLSPLQDGFGYIFLIFVKCIWCLSDDVASLRLDQNAHTHLG